MSSRRTITVEEQQRTYYYKNGDTLNFFGVTSVGVSESGNHYLTHERGLAIVAPGWQAVEIVGPKGWTF